MKRILILGAKGMLGCELMESFKDFELYGWDMEEIDITSREQVDEKIGELKPNIVINAAAYADVDGCETNEELARKVNGDAVGYLASICQKIGAIFVHYSTDYVFGGDNPRGYKEDAIHRVPLGIYGQSKLLGEELLLKRKHRSSELSCPPKRERRREFAIKSELMFYLIRTSWLFGKHGKNFVDTMLKLAQNQDELKVVNDQHGKPTYTLDLAQRTREIIEKQLPCGIYHLTNEGVTTWYDFAKQVFADLSGLSGFKRIPKIIPCTSQEFPRPAKRPQYSILLNTKLTPSRSWQEALREYLTGRNNGDKIKTP